MIILERDGSMVTSEDTHLPAPHADLHVDLPAALVTQASHLIERVLDLFFNLSTIRRLELRVREEDLCECS